jgi:hypothetical protein
MKNKIIKENRIIDEKIQIHKCGFVFSQVVSLITIEKHLEYD